MRSGVGVAVSVGSGVGDGTAVPVGVGTAVTVAAERGGVDVGVTVAVGAGVSEGVADMMRVGVTVGNAGLSSTYHLRNSTAKEAIMRMTSRAAKMIDRFLCLMALSVSPLRPVLSLAAVGHEMSNRTGQPHRG